jgi:uncharacterized membrane protein YphA (DoxX/SURF4 family)
MGREAKKASTRKNKPRISRILTDKSKSSFIRGIRENPWPVFSLFPLPEPMMTTSSALPKTIAGVRIATSVFFLMFGEYKLAGPGFAHGGFQGYLRDYIATTAVSFYRPLLSGLILPHAVFFGYLVGVIEMFVGLCLLLGFWVRPACAVGVFLLINITLASWWDPGPGAPLWRYFGSRLDTGPLILLLITLYAADAGRAWGLDGRRRG